MRGDLKRAGLGVGLVAKLACRVDQSVEFLAQCIELELLPVYCSAEFGEHLILKCYASFEFDDAVVVGFHVMSLLEKVIKSPACLCYHSAVSMSAKDGSYEFT